MLFAHLRALGWGLIAILAIALPSQAQADDHESSCCSSTPPRPGSDEKGWTMTAEELARLGKVSFPISCSPAVAPGFAQAVAMLHSFWYEEAGRAFQAIASADPSCAMAYWGVAMSLYHQLWTPPASDALAQGAAAVERAKAAGARTARERAYIAAITAFYTGADKLDHAQRAAAYQKAMKRVYLDNPADKEAAIFYALSLIANAAPSDKKLVDQRRAGEILEKIFAIQPDHPGAAHYIIHAYDTPVLANRALAAAHRYAKIAPSAPHALHMPSHTFTQVGAWQDSIESNIASAAAAKAYAARTLMTGTWDEQLHAMDYLEYAYLQLGQDAEAKAVLQELAAIHETTPARSRKAAYAFAAIPARYALERRRWHEAAALEPRPGPFLRAAAVTYFARGYARARLGDLVGARADLERLADAHARIAARADELNDAAPLIEAERLAVAAWIAHAEGHDDEALRSMRAAADLEDADDGPGPGPIVRARELLGELLLELGQPRSALAEFRTALSDAPGRFNGRFGAARAAQKLGDRDAAALFGQLDALCSKASCDRPELTGRKATPDK